MTREKKLCIKGITTESKHKLVQREVVRSLGSYSSTVGKPSGPVKKEWVLEETQRKCPGCLVYKDLEEYVGGHQVCEDCCICDGVIIAGCNCWERCCCECDGHCPCCCRVMHCQVVED